MRIRNNREFFNVAPEDARAIFNEEALLLDDAEIEEVFKQVVIGRNDKSSVEKSTAPREKSVVWLLPANRKFFDVDGLKRCAVYTIYTHATLTAKYIYFFTRKDLGIIH